MPFLKQLDQTQYSGRFPFVRAGQTLPDVMRISLVIKTIQPDYQILNSVQGGDSFSAKTLGKSRFHRQNDWSDRPVLTNEQRH